MGIHIGTSTKNQAAIQIGNTSMGKVYVGDKLVWQKGGGSAPANLKYGNYYNYYAARQYSDQFIEGMRVPNISEYLSILRHNNITDLVSNRVIPIPRPRWVTGSLTGQFTNALNFSVLPSGERTYQTGNAISEGDAEYHWLIKTVGDGDVSYVPSTLAPYVQYTRNSIYSGALSTSLNAGYCIRLCRDAVGNEISAPSGTILGTVQDYDGNSYELVKLYGKLETTNPVREYHLVFTVQDLLTTKLINGQNIPIIPHSTSGRNTWTTMDTPGMSTNLRN